MKVAINSFKKIIFYSAGSISLVSLVALAFSLLKSTNIVQSIFTANFIVGTVIISVGILGFIFPVSFKSLKKNNVLMDHSNIADVLREEKEVKLNDSIFNICWGICHIVIIGIIEILVKSII